MNFLAIGMMFRRLKVGMNSQIKPGCLHSGLEGRQFQGAFDLHAAMGGSRKENKEDF